MAKNFEITLKAFQNDIEGNFISIRQMLAVMNNRGFGAVLIILCLIEMLPTGTIPGVPSLVATLIILTSLQILFGRHHPWVPDFIGKRRFSRARLEKGLNKTMPVVKWIDRRTHERWRFLISRPAERLSALMIIMLALTFYPLELVPFASSIPAFIISLFGISFITKDGLLSLITWVIALCGLIGIPLFMAFYVF
jgi:hypothetical protein